MPPIPKPRSSGFTQTTPVPLYWAAYGREGAPRLLVLHGGPGAHHDYLLPQMLTLAERYELIFYDQRGGGQSKTEDRSPITWETHVADLGLVVQELVGEPVSIVGYSWGGLLAVLYTVEAFERGDESTPAPARLVLIDPAPVTRRFRAQFEANFNQRQTGASVVKLREELAQSGLRERDPDAYRQRAFELSVAGYFADPGRARDLTPFRVIGRVQQQVWESLGDFDLLQRVEQVEIPVLILHGRHDPIPLEASEALGRALPDARLVVLEHSGHVPYVEEPERLFTEIERFLEEAPVQAR
ncbi:MAG TPA: alpha/beta hydrolase [Gemmatimonadaceae bacterium]|nr:alpha/beta hydrolase [Gemmatimonadaceae bacterium]